MRHLNSKFIERINTPEIKEYFLLNFGQLMSVLAKTHKNKDHYHDKENIFGVGYITMLTVYYFNGLTLKDLECFNSLIKAALLQNYCYLGSDDDNVNIDHTLEEVEKLLRSHPHLFNEFDAIDIVEYISLSHNNMKVEPIKDPLIPAFIELAHRFIIDSYKLYPALCCNTKILNNLYLDKKVESKSDFDTFKRKLVIDFYNLNGERTTAFSKIVYKEIKSQLETLCLSTH